MTLHFIDVLEKNIKIIIDKNNKPILYGAGTSARQSPITKLKT